MADLGRVLGAAFGSGSENGNIIMALLNGLAGGSQSQASRILSSVMSLIQQNGGLESVLDLLKKNGLDQVAGSWVSSNPNLDINADQIQLTFDPALMEQIASKLGVNSGQAGAVMANILPELVNQLTPAGEVSEDQDNLISKGLDLLKSVGGLL